MSEGESAADDVSAVRVLLRPALLGLHLFAVAAVAITLVMGLWQLGVYDTQQEYEQDVGRDVAAVPLDEALGPDDAFGGAADNRLVEATGSFGPADRQLWVSGRSLDGRSGYWLVAPFVVDGGALLVVRGWADDNGPLPEPPDVSRIEAVLQPSEESGDQLGADRTTGSVAIPLLANELPYDLYAGFAIQTDPAPGDGLEAVPPPDPSVSWTVGLRNLLYAIQWWVFGVFAVFLWLRMCRDLVSERRVPRPQGGREVPPAQRGTSEQ
ncbi:MAG: SURF1 family protein [Nocardioidaceae bacterium]